MLRTPARMGGVGWAHASPAAPKLATPCRSDASHPCSIVSYRAWSIMAWPLLNAKPSLWPMPKAPVRPPAHPALVQFAARLIELRKARGISQERLATESGIGRSYLSGVERALRNISLINITKLAAALEVEPCRLLERSGS